MPAFPDPKTILTRDEAVNAILISIALEETALSHILNAEGEKIQRALENVHQHSDLQRVLEVNQSVAAMLEQITDMQLVLTNKLHKALRCIPKAADGAPSGNPVQKPRPPCPPCPGRPCAHQR
ncbi:MAG: hypothetical protein LBR76_05570 [Oscillospiraceae bacterium]|jgi:hypothetical protein|nr:hypothetical protein [Oscillospiraceae bacterium]